MKRRTFIWTPLLLSLGTALKLDAHAQIDSSTATECEPLLRCFSNPAEAAEVGQHYLADKPELADVEQLMRDIGLRNANYDTPVAITNAQFEAAKRRDFTIGNTVCLEGWILSKAEASLCALAYLLPINV